LRLTPSQLGAVYEAGKKVWMAEMLPEDADAGNLSMEGRVMEMLSGMCGGTRLVSVLTLLQSIPLKDGWKVTSFLVSTFVMSLCCV
jgi:hypothetical protein